MDPAAVEQIIISLATLNYKAHIIVSAADRAPLSAEQHRAILDSVENVLIRLPVEILNTLTTVPCVDTVTSKLP